MEITYSDKSGGQHKRKATKEEEATHKYIERQSKRQEILNNETGVYGAKIRRSLGILINEDKDFLSAVSKIMNEMAKIGE